MNNAYVEHNIGTTHKNEVVFYLSVYSNGAYVLIDEKT